MIVERNRLQALHQALAAGGGLLVAQLLGDTQGHLLGGFGLLLRGHLIRSPDFVSKRWQMAAGIKAPWPPEVQPEVQQRYDALRR